MSFKSVKKDKTKIKKIKSKEEKNYKHGPVHQLRLPPGLSSLKIWFQRSNLSLTEEQYKQLWQYHCMLRDKNPEYDLTRLYQFDNMVQKHYIDCILVAGLLNWELPSPLLDIGTGAGLPSIPLKIVCPDTEFILSEGRHKRVKFLHEVVEALGLNQIEIYDRKIYPSFSRPVNGVITRAVESIPETLDRVKRSLVPHGKVIFMKGPHCDEEIREALTTFKDDYRLDDDIAYTIPHTSHHRRLVIFERLEIKKEAEIINHYKIHEIESNDNKIFKHFKSLLVPKGIKRYGQALVFGQKIIREVMRDLPQICIGLIFSPDLEKGLDERSYEGFPHEVQREKWHFYRLNTSLYHELDIFGTGTDILLVETPGIKDWQIAETGAGCTLMIPFQDPENIGTIVRTAVAFGVKEAILLQEAANPYHPKSIRAGGSAIFKMNYLKGPSLQEIKPEEIQKSGLPLITLSMEGRDVRDFQFPSGFILLTGVEGPGLPESLRTRALAIPIESNIESLNAATATAIALYEWKRMKSINK